MMKNRYSKYITINQKFNDFELFNQATQLWDFDFRQLDKGRFEAHLIQIASPELQIGEGKFSRKLYQMGSAPKGLRTFGILDDKSTPTIWRGSYTNQDKILVFPKDGELEAFSDPGFDALTISFKDDLLFDVMGTLGITSDNDVYEGPDVVVSDPIKIAKLRQSISRVLKQVEMQSLNMTEEQLEYELEYEIPRSLLLSLVGDKYYETKPDPTSRYMAVKRVMEYIESKASDNITVRELCKVSGVSERTLRYAFQDNLGVSPKAFVNLFRLNRIRRELRTTHPDDKNISDIVNQWGFWHMGQFAKDYKRLFGELPSETKRL